MAKVRQTFAGILFAIFLVTSLAAPAMAGSNLDKAEKKGKPIVILCEGTPGGCPCPGC